MIVCRSCGHENADGADFCASCGTFLEWTGEKIAEPKPTPPPRPTPRPAPQAGTSKPATSSSSSPAREHAKPATSASAATSKPAAASPTSGAKAGEPAGAASAAASGTAKAAEPAASSGNSAAAAKAPAPEPSEEDRKKAEDAARARALVTRPTAVTPASRATQPARPAQPRADGGRQPTAQRPVAQKPGAAKPRVAPKPPPKAKGREYKPGDKICGQCGEGNDPARKFCRKCGTSLVEAVVAAEPPWWKRLFSREKKTLKAGERRTRADGTLKDGRPQVFKGLKKVFNVLLAIVAVLLMFAFIGPWRGSVMDTMRDATNKVKRIFIAEYEPLHADGIEATTALPDHPAAMAIDGATNFAWQENAQNDGEGQTLVLTFNQQVNIDQIGIRSGASNEQEQFLAQPRPRDLHIVFSNGTTKDIRLKDSPEFQTFKIKAHAVVRMEITVTSVIPSFKGGHDMGISEIELFTRK